MICQGKVSIDTLRSGKRAEKDSCNSLCEKLKNLDADERKEFEEDETSIYEYDYECLKRKKAMMECSCAKKNL